MRCAACRGPVEKSRRDYADPTCFACLKPPLPIPVDKCACSACRQIRGYLAEMAEARSADLPPCTACGKPATLTTNERAIATYARHGRTPPQICDACAWERVVAALDDGTTTADYDKPPPPQRERATHTTVGGRGAVGRIKR